MQQRLEQARLARASLCKKEKLVFFALNPPGFGDVGGFLKNLDFSNPKSKVVSTLFQEIVEIFECFLVQVCRMVIDWFGLHCRTDPPNEKSSWIKSIAGDLIFP